MGRFVYRMAVFSLLVLALFWVGCQNPFATRKAQAPFMGEGRLDILPRVSSQNVMKNLLTSLKGFSGKDYLDCFADNFIFKPDPSEETRYEDIFSTPWTKERESSFINRLLDRNVTSAINTTQSDKYALVETAQEDHYEYNYSWNVQHNRLMVPKLIMGKADIYLTKDENGNWAITRWVDTKTEAGNSTYGELKAKL